MNVNPLKCWPCERWWNTLYRGGIIYSPCDVGIEGKGYFTSDGGIRYSLSGGGITKRGTRPGTKVVYCRVKGYSLSDGVIKGKGYSLSYGG